MEIEIFESNSLYAAYPQEEIVFEGRAEREYLLPLGILDWTYQKTGKSFKILIAAPIGDEEGFIAPDGTIGEQSYGEFWLTYYLNDSKWRLDSSRENFSVQSTEGHYHYEDVKKSFAEKKKFYEENGFLQNIRKPEPRPKFKKPLFNIGGIASPNSNWFGDVYKTFKHNINKLEVDSGKMQKSVTLFDKDDNEFVYLGHVNAWTYSTPLSAQLHYFFELKNQRVLVITEYT